MRTAQTHSRVKISVDLQRVSSPDMSDSLDPMLAFLAVSFGLKLQVIYRNYTKKSENKPEFVGEVSDLLLYPLKAARGLSLSYAVCTERGLKHHTETLFDRNFTVLASDGHQVSASREGLVATIQCRLEKGHLVLETDSLPPLKLPMVSPVDKSKSVNARILGEPIVGQDCGDEAAEWICKHLGKPGFRLIYGADGLSKRQLNQQTDKWKKNAKDSDFVTFQNGYPLMMASRSSLNKLNSKLTAAVEMNRFRPNIEVTGSQPFDEDEWKEVWVGKMKFTQLKPCNRCPVTLVDPKTGKASEEDEPLRTLRTFRLKEDHFSTKPLFGILLVLDSTPGVIRVGDPVYVVRGDVLNRK